MLPFQTPLPFPGATHTSVQLDLNGGLPLPFLTQVWKLARLAQRTQESRLLTITSSYKGYNWRTAKWKQGIRQGAQSCRVLSRCTTVPGVAMCSPILKHSSLHGWWIFIKSLSCAWSIIASVSNPRPLPDGGEIGWKFQASNRGLLFPVTSPPNQGCLGVISSEQKMLCHPGNSKGCGSSLSGIGGKEGCFWHPYHSGNYRDFRNCVLGTGAETKYIYF